MKKLGKYEILEEIGRGGFATVYKARDPNLDQLIALKVLQSAYADRPDVVQRFVNEARKAVKLKHPGIVRIYAVDEGNGVPYIAMEYLPGGTLADRLHGEPLPLESVITIVEQIAAALDCAHKRSLVHRDIKPANVLFDEEGRAVLVDFGLVKSLAESGMTIEGASLGTPFYMSPEQAEGDEVDHRSDVYSLGVVAYQMCTGRAPFDATSPLAVLRLHVDKAPPPPRELNPHLTVEVEQVLLKALAKKREERYQSAGELAQALREAMEAAEQARQREEQEPQLRRIDAAAPSHAQVDQTIDLLVQVRFPDSPLLGIESWPTKQKPPSLEQVSESVAIQFPVDRRTGKPGPVCLEVRVVAPDFEVKGAAHRRVEVPPDRDSQRVSFLLLAKKADRCKIKVEIYRSDGVYFGAIPLEVDTTGKEKASTPNTLVASRIILTRETQRRRTTWLWIVARVLVLGLLLFLASSQVVTPPPPPPGTLTRPTDGMVMVHVPGGAFQMGRKPSDRRANPDESPEHTVALDGFWIDRTEVTNAQFAAFLNERRKEAEEVTAWLALENKACLIKQVGDEYEAKSSYAEHPVIEVTWNGAKAYCEWAGARLPTEAEWEYAARGTKGYNYPWGNNFSCSRGNFDDERYVTTVFVLKGGDKCDGNTTTAPVGSFPAGASWCKALDMAGNVSEWVADWYDAYPPAQQTNPTGPLSGTLKVARGGAWYVPTPDLPLAARRYPHPPENHDRGLGFRCAISQESESR